MDARLRAYFDMLIRVDRYGRIYANYFVRTSMHGKLFAIVRASVDEIERLRKKQRLNVPAARLQILSKAVIKETLIREMDDLELIADIIAFEVPALEDKFRVPWSYDDEKVLSAARAFAEDAVPLRDEFLKYARPESFIDDLNALISELEEAIAARDQVSAARDSAPGARLCVEAAIDDAMERGLKAARVLNAIMDIRFRDGGPDLLEWLTTNHVSYVYRSNPAPARSD